MLYPIGWSEDDAIAIDHEVSSSHLNEEHDIFFEEDCFFIILLHDHHRFESLAHNYSCQADISIYI